MPKLIIFDVDGTLTIEDGNAWDSLTICLGGSLDEHHAVLKKYRAGEMSNQDAIDAIVEIWKKSGRASKENICKILDNIKLREDALDTINYLKKKYEVCLISGGLDFYVNHVAEHLGVKDAYTFSHLLFDENDYLKTFTYRKDQAEAKLEVFKTIIKERNLNPEDCIAIGDSDNDVLLFKNVGKSFIIHNDKNEELHIHADHVIGSLGELKEWV